MSGQRERVLASLFASTGKDCGGPARHHLTDEQFTDLAVRWMWAVVRDREENGPLGGPQRPVYREEAA